MTDLRAAAQQALEALEALQGGCTDSDDGTVEAITVWCPEVIDALRAALAEPVEPVAWGVFGANLHDMFFAEEEAHEMAMLKGDGSTVAPLYASPPQRPAEPVQEPVAVVRSVVGPGDDGVRIKWLGGFPQIGDRLYTSPQQRPAEPVQEPVAWKDKFYESLHHQDFGNSIPLYAAPPQRLPLTDEEIGSIFDSVVSAKQEPWFWRFARAIEQKHGIGSKT